MKIKMLEHFQGRNQPTLSFGQVCKVGEDVSQALADWLLANGKAELAEESEHYGAQPLTDETQLAHDNITDAALKLAEEYGIDPFIVKGTGAAGRVLLSDVQAYIEAETSEQESKE